MKRLIRCLSAPVAVISCFLAVSASAERPSDPLRFFEGRTESSGTVKLITKKPFESRATGRGEIKPDGSLVLQQRVQEEGRDPFMRVWRIKKVRPGLYTGTMSEAKGPVTIEEIDGRFRFRFKMKGGLNIEQWLIPDADWRSGRNKLTIKKFGLTVGTSEGVIRKVD